jgi:hypothetical protein
VSVPLYQAKAEFFRRLGLPAGLKEAGAAA